jgi:hypothetical protein
LQPNVIHILKIVAAVRKKSIFVIMEIGIDGTTEHVKLFPFAKPKGKVIAFGRDITRFFGSGKLLGEGKDNPKLKKSQRKSFVLYLAPAKFGKLMMNGSMINTCPNASPECIATCLNTAGNPAYLETKISSRIDKTAFYYEYKDVFLTKLAREIYFQGMKFKDREVAVRVNGTSDLAIVDEMMNKGLLKNIPKNIIFYDYTKRPERAGVFKLKSGHYYVVTFSRSELNSDISKKLLAKGCNVAIPFRKKLPKKWHGFVVIDADKADDLMIDLAYGKYKEIDPKTGKATGNVYTKGPSSPGYVLGLAAKGQLKKFRSKRFGAAGFVIDCDNFDNCTTG